MPLVVMKFGGTAVGMVPGLNQLVGVVLRERERTDQRLILVVSALDGVTDQLHEVAHFAMFHNRRAYRRIVAILRTRHLALIDLLFTAVEREALQANIDQLLFEMLDTCQNTPDDLSDRDKAHLTDKIISTGERLAARIVAALLRSRGVRGVAIDADDFLITDSTFENAKPQIEATKKRIDTHLLPLVDRGIVPVVTGFIGTNDAGETTTLGRGGSDYTASLIALCSDADEVVIWTDVEGMMSSDPDMIANAQTIAHLSYDEAAEMAFLGARVLHREMIAPLRQRNIPLTVRSIFKPTVRGTRIEQHSSSMGAKAIVCLNGIGLLTSQAHASIADLIGHVDKALQKQSGSPIEGVIAAQSAAGQFICIGIPTSASPDTQRQLQNALDANLLDAGGWRLLQVAIVSVIGRTSDALTTMLGAVDGITIHAIALYPKQIAVSFVVDAGSANRLIALLHERLITADQ